MTAGERAARLPRNGGEPMAAIDYLPSGLVQMTDARLELVTSYLKEARAALTKLDQYASLSAMDGAMALLTDALADYERYLQGAAIREAEAIRRRGPTRDELRRR